MSRSSHNRLAGLAALLVRDRLELALFPDRIVMTRLGGWRRRIRHLEIVALAPAGPDAPGWGPALAALAGALSRGALAGADVTLVLSNHFVHYALVPRSELLTGEEEQLAFARHRIARVHGGSAQGWMLRLSAAGSRQARLACGVPQALVDALNAVMAPLGARYRSLQPLLMSGFNRWRARLAAQPGWFVIAEPGLLCVALLQEGQWQSVRTIRIGPDPAAELIVALERERCLVDSTSDCNRVWVYAPELPAFIAPQPAGWTVEHLGADAVQQTATGVPTPPVLAMGA